MPAQSRLNLLVTHEERPARAPEAQPWYETLSQMLAPLGVATFEATSGPQAVSLIEQRPIHLAVVDTRLAESGGMNVLRMLQLIRQRAERPDYWAVQDEARRTQVFRLEMQVEEQGRRIEVRFDSSPAPPTPMYPAIILLTPQPSDKLMQEALRFDAFSVLAEPVDVNMMLEVMARAMKRFHHNHWPQ